MKEQPRTQITHSRGSNLKHKMKKLQILQKLLYKKYYVHEKILRTRNCQRNFIINLLTKKHKENMYTKQQRFTSRLKYFTILVKVLFSLMI